MPLSPRLRVVAGVTKVLDVMVVVHDLCLPCRDPYVTGTSVLGIVFKDGVMLAADTLGAHQLTHAGAL